MKKKSVLVGLLICIQVLSAHTGFSKSNTNVPRDLFLIVNDFTMTVSEFNELVEYEQAVAKTLKLSPLLPEDLIAQIIYKQLLIQEAQKSQSSRNNESIRCAQGDSEAALIKNILSLKSNEFKNNLIVSDDELVDYYNKNRRLFNNSSFQKSKEHIQVYVLKDKIHHEMEKWIDDLKDNAEITLFKDHLK